MEPNTQDNSKEEIVEAQPKSLEEQAIETGGTLMPQSQTIRHDH